MADDDDALRIDLLSPAQPRDLGARIVRYRRRRRILERFAPRRAANPAVVHAQHSHTARGQALRDLTEGRILLESRERDA